MSIRIIILAMLVAAACTPAPIQDSAPPQDTVENTEVVPTDATATPIPAVEDGLQKKMTQIVAGDLATRLGVDRQTIRVISMEALTWPNAALGCPLPGKVYAQGTVPGFRIRLEADSKEYSYHTDRLGQFVLCANVDPDLENLPEIPVTPGEIDDGQPWVPAD